MNDFGLSSVNFKKDLSIEEGSWYFGTNENVIELLGPMFFYFFFFLFFFSFFFFVKTFESWKAQDLIVWKKKLWGLGPKN